jgi:hypothetical protein
LTHKKFYYDLGLSGVYLIMSKCNEDTKYDRTLLYGLPAIGAYMGYSVRTIGRWIHREGFPAGKLPEGVWMSSTELVDRWLMTRNPCRKSS